MSDPDHTDSLVSDLLRQGRFVRSVARELVSGADQDDVVQDTWLSALEHRPTPGRGLAAWLKTVARNLALKALRGRRRRDARQRRAARPEAIAGGQELSERDQRLCSVLDAVMALDEPFRSVIVLRFYEGLSPAAVAERLDIPAATVRTRTHRAIERLREQLDERYGNRATWSAALFTLAFPELAKTGAVAAASSVTTSPVYGSILVGKKILIATVLAGLAGVSLIWWTAQDDGARVRGSAAAASDAPADAPPAPTPTATKAPVSAIVPTAFAPRPDDDGAVATGPALAAGGGVRLTGRVIDETGRSIASCAVRFRPETPAAAATGALLVADVQTDAAGRFVFPNAPGGDMFVVTARPPQLADATCRARAPQRGELDLGDLVAQVGGAISGRVVDVDGAPVHGATVAAEPVADRTGNVIILGGSNDGFQDARTAVTEADGHYVLAGLPEGEVRARAMTEQLPPASRRGIRVKRDTITPEIDFRLPAGAMVAGIVRDEAGKPVPGAKITGHSAIGAWATGDSAGTSDPPRRAISDNDGRFALHGMRASSNTVSAAKPGYRTTRVETADDGAPLVITLKAAASVYGRITDPKGAPVKGAQVALLADGNGFIRFSGFMSGGGSFTGGGQPRALVGADAAKMLGETDDGSWFIFPGVSLEKAAVVAKGAPGFADGKSAVVEFKGSERVRADVTVIPECVIKGTVKDDAGAPVAGASVSYTRDEDSTPNAEPHIASQYGSTETGPDGTFQLSNLGPGNYSVNAGHRELLEGKSRPVVLTTPGEVAQADLTLARGCTLTGRAFDAHGRALSGAVVTVRPLDHALGEGPSVPSLLTDPQGRFKTHGIVAGRYAASIEAPRVTGGGMQISFVTLDGGDDQPKPAPPLAAGEVSFAADPAHPADIELRALPAAAVSGVVTSAGQPVAGVSVTLGGAAGGAGRHLGYSGPLVKTDAHGAFYFGSATAGEHVLSCDVEGAPKAIEVPITVEAGQERSVEVALPTGGIEGRVVDERGAGIAGVTVTAELEENAAAKKDRSQLASGFALSLALSGGESSGEEGEDSGLGGSFLALGGRSPHVTTDQDGNFRFIAVSEGSWSLRSTAAALVPGERTGVKVRTGQVTKRVDLQIAAGGAILVTVDAGGLAVTNCTVTATPVQGSKAKSDSADIGKPVRLEGLYPGKWHITADSWGADVTGRAAADVEIRAGDTTPLRLTLHQQDD